MNSGNRPKKKEKAYIPEQSVTFADQYAWGESYSSTGFNARYATAKPYGIRMHRHPYVQIWFCCSGVYRHFFMDTEIELGAGSLVIVPPYFPHSIDNRNNAVLISCDFRNDFIMDLSSQSSDDSLINMIFFAPVLANAKQIQPIYYFSDETSAEIEQLLDESCREFKKKDSFSTLLVRANLTRLFAIVANEYALSGQDKRISAYRDALYSALKYMHEHYMEKLYLEDVAKIAAMNRQTFSYLFKELMGMTFSKYIQYLRVLHAKDLLSSSNRTQQDISDALGFRGAPFFQKVFKEFTGVLPGQFRAESSNDE